MAWGNTSLDMKVAEDFFKDVQRVDYQGRLQSAASLQLRRNWAFLEENASSDICHDGRKEATRHKPIKDRLTLGLCANARGYCKGMLLLLYQSETPRAFKAHKANEEKFPKLWRANAKPCVTTCLFTKWVNLRFSPTAKRYSEEKRLPLKFLLALNNAHSHTHDIEKYIKVDFTSIKLLYLPINTTHLLLIDPQVISSFKNLYMKYLYKRCFKITDSTNLTLEEFWKDHFNFVICLRLINNT
ncbi:tigger transposable element-derived protein 1-like [Palaemon carinicauda]|uniref:tigger transposable element-derived protein 1-like n=1 Tax=Palaemon carinicauda TaxID=392227 RepID=UPI0035B68265